MDTRGGPDWCGKDMDRSLSIDHITAILVYCFVAGICLVILYIRAYHVHGGVSTSYGSDTLACQESNVTVLTLICCLIYALGLATSPIVTAIYRRYDKWWRQPIRMKDTKSRIETGEYEYKYPVFVSASSYMDDGELRQITMALERQLQIACRTDRQLVCSGDDIEPGRRIFSETTSLLEEAGMMVIVIIERT